MKRLAVVVSMLVVACSPVTAPCGPSTCLGGCCDAQGQCVPGNSLAVCGAAGSACAVCADSQRCLSGVCTSTDAGVEVDAGPLHVVELRQTNEFFRPDGSVLVDEVELNSLPALPLFIETADGGWRELTRAAASGPALRYEAVPDGPWLFGKDGLWFVSDADRFDIGARTVGHRRRPATAPSTLLTVQVRGVVPGFQPGEGINVGVSSIASGLTSDTARLTATPGDESLSAAVDLSSAVQPFGVNGSGGDDLTVVLRRTVGAPDGGAARWGAAVASAKVAAPDISSGTTGTAEADLLPLPSQSTRLRAQTLEFMPFATAVHPSAVMGLPSVFVFAYAPADRAGGTGDFEGRTTQLGSIGNRMANVDFTITHGNPFAGFPLLIEARLPVTVSLDVGGRTFSRVVDGISVVHTDGMPIGLELTPPTRLSLDGQPAQQPRSSTGTTPELTWSAPAVGTPTTYLVTISRVSNEAPPVETVVARVSTPFTRLRMPPGVLIEGAPHFAIVTAVASTGVDGKRWGQRRSRQSARASAMTGVFIP